MNRILCFLICILLFSCKTSPPKIQEETTLSLIEDLQRAIVLNNIGSASETEDSLKPVWGYRFVIEGDFNGDGEKEKLIERFVSCIDYEETNKFYENLPDYDELVSLTMKKEPRSFLLSDNPLIDTLPISANAQQLGLSYLKNEGDLNGDGTDEVSYVVNWADWSSINTCYLVTYRDGKWETLYSFRIWDWQLPDLPGVVSQYGLFGLDDKGNISPDDTINMLQERELLNFEGLIQKIETNKIQIIYSNDEAEMDTIIVQIV